MEIQTDNKTVKIALLVALACTMQIAESMIPHPVPGLRLGLANMLTLTAMVVLGFRYAMEVAILRVILSSLIIGTFISPTFILSFCAALSSTLVMGFFFWVSGYSQRFRMSLAGISIIGAFIHNLVQLSLAYLLLIKHSGIFLLFPWLTIGAVFTGWMVGIVAGHVCGHLQEPSNALKTTRPDERIDTTKYSVYIGGSSWLHQLPAELKIISVTALAIHLVIIDQALFFIAVFILLVTFAISSRIPFFMVLKRIFKFKYLVLCSFLLPLFFNSGTAKFVSFGFINLSVEGIRLSSFLSTRIFLMVFASSLLTAVTAPEDLVSGISRLLYPLGVFGFSARRTAQIISIAWAAIPKIAEQVRNTAIGYEFGKLKSISKLPPALGDFIATLFIRAQSADSELLNKEPIEKNDSTY